MNEKLEYIIFGYLLSTCITGCTQDMMGKEKYIKAVQVGWVDTSPLFWVGVLFVALTIWFLKSWVSQEEEKLRKLKMKLVNELLSKIGGSNG